MPFVRHSFRATTVIATALVFLLISLYLYETDMRALPLLTTLVASVNFALGQANPQNGTSSTTFTNPILNSYGADPWVIRHTDNYYYMLYTTNDNITMLRSQTLTDWNNADVKLAFKAPDDTNFTYDSWAPELHYFEAYQKFYIIYTADVDPDSPAPQVDMLCDFNCPAVHHRMFVLESSGQDPWESEYTMKAELDTYDQFAIDGTYFQYQDRLFHIYSCWYDKYTSWPANLCISESKFCRFHEFEMLRTFTNT